MCRITLSHPSSLADYRGTTQILHTTCPSTPIFSTVNNISVKVPTHPHANALGPLNLSNARPDRNFSGSRDVLEFGINCSKMHGSINRSTSSPNEEARNRLPPERYGAKQRPFKTASELATLIVIGLSMFYNMIWLVRGNHDSDGQVQKSTGHPNEMHSPIHGPSKGKTRSLFNGDGRERKGDGDSNRGGGDGSRKAQQRPLKGIRNFACPFFKHDPRKFSARVCSGPGWPTIHRVKSVSYLLSLTTTG